MGTSNFDSAADPELYEFPRASLLEREANLIVAFLKQALEDCERIGKDARLTGETAAPKAKAVTNAIHRADLVRFMERDVRFGISSLEYCMRFLALTSGHRFCADDFRRVMLDALDGRPTATLLDWRGPSVTTSRAHPAPFRAHSRSEARLKRDRRRYAEKRAAVAA